MIDLVVEAEKYVVHILNNYLDTRFVYHNLAHTQRVVRMVSEMITELGIEGDEKESLLIASWFHDTGYIKGTENHEMEGVKIASKFLKEHNVSDEKIRLIANLILVTKMGETPKTEFEKIIVDADCAHLGSSKFFTYLELLRKEWELNQYKSYSENEWIDLNINLLS